MRVILIHGFNATPEMNFHPWLARELAKQGIEVIVPTLALSTKDALQLPEIIESLKSQIGYLKNDDILMGHSLGGFIILQYLERIEMTETPRAVVLVAAPWKVSNPELRQLFIADLDADVLMWKAREFVVVHSDDDALVPFEHGKNLAERLKARFVATSGDDHYLGEQYPVLLKTVQEIMSTPFEYAPGQSLTDDFSNVRL